MKKNIGPGFCCRCFRSVAPNDPDKTALRKRSAHRACVMRTARATVVMSVAGWLEQNASAERVLRFRKLVARVRGDHEALVALVSEAFYDHDRHEAISCQVRLNVEKLLVTTIPAMPNAAALSRLECQSGVRLAVNAALTVN